MDCLPAGLLPARAGSLRLFRRLVLAMLLEAYEEGRLRFFAEHAVLAERQAFAAFLRPLKRSEWVVYAKRPFAGPEAVLAYLSRYTHRVAISNSRLIAADASSVTFKVTRLWRCDSLKCLIHLGMGALTVKITRKAARVRDANQSRRLLALVSILDNKAVRHPRYSLPMGPSLPSEPGL